MIVFICWMHTKNSSIYCSIVCLQTASLNDLRSAEPLLIANLFVRCTPSNWSSHCKRWTGERASASGSAREKRKFMHMENVVCFTQTQPPKQLAAKYSYIVHKTYSTRDAKNRRSEDLLCAHIWASTRCSMLCLPVFTFVSFVRFALSLATPAQTCVLNLKFILFV